MFSSLRSELRAFLCWKVRLGCGAFDVVRARLTPVLSHQHQNQERNDDLRLRADTQQHMAPIAGTMQNI